MQLFHHCRTRHRVRGDSQLVHFLLIALIILLTVFGMFPIHYNPRGRKHFAFSKIYFAYGLTMLIAFSSIYTHQIYEEYVQSQLNLQDSLKLYNCMNVAVTIINFLSQLVVCKKMECLLNNVPLFDTLKEFNMNAGNIKQNVYTAMIKVLGFPLMFELALILQQLRTDPQRSLLWTLYTLCPMLLSHLLTNSFYGAMIVTRALLEAINARLYSQVEQVNFMQQEKQLKLQSKYFRMERYCILADELDLLAIKYKIVCASSIRFTDILAVSLTMSLLCHLLGITVGFFNQYNAIADTFIENKSYDAYGAFTNLIFLAISFSDIALLSNLSSSILIRSRQTGTILQNITLHLADVRYKQSVEEFTLQVFRIKYKIRPLGLFELSISLVNDVLSTVASFLLILIQTDLSQRFKKK